MSDGIMNGVQYLNLSKCGLEANSVQSLLESKCIRSLEYLILAGNEIKNLPKPDS
jgi:hypothetical protein